jgi:hypothetical protein
LRTRTVIGAPVDSMPQLKPPLPQAVLTSLRRLLIHKLQKDVFQI